MLAYMLCHRPDEFGLVLSPDGWVSMKELLQALAGEPGFGHVRRRQVEEVAALATPAPLEIVDDQVRGLNPGPALLRRPPGEPPPPLLYLAIPPRVHEKVFADGAKAPAGRELLLARTAETALKLGRRRAPKPILVTIQAQAAAKAGVLFQGYGEDLWLAPAIPRPFLELPPSPQAPPKPAKEARPAAPLPGTLPVRLKDLFPEPRQARRKTGEPAWKTGAKAARRKKREP
jgi:putative RNA 2'-phosphotransferase